MRMAILASVFALPSLAFAADPLVEPHWLADQLGDDNLVVLDVRNQIDGGSYETYLQGHIPGAVHSDYVKDGWRTKRGDVVGVVGDTAVLEALLSSLGVGSEDHVVITHAGKGATDFGSAARIYWTLKYLGHDDVSILNGGWKGWVADPTRPIETGEVEVDADIFKANLRPELIVTTDEVKASFDDPEVVRVDARPLDFFIGKLKHNAAKLFGRLPDADHFDQSQLFLADGRLKPEADLRGLMEAQLGDGVDKEIFSYCNTGHWASTNWFVMSEMLGIERVRLYDDSMVGWTADPQNLVETGS